MPFSPIAIVGQACLLPGADSPEALWKLVLEGRDATSRAPDDRWRLAKTRVLSRPDDDARDRAWSDAGGYVTSLPQTFDPRAYAIGEDEVRALDPLFQWVLHVGRGALVDAGLDALASARARTGVVIGNLSFPTDAHSRFAEHAWLAGQRDPALAAATERLVGAPPSPSNRFSSGLPARMLARALGLGGDAYALDAACASSLYAIELACRALHDRRADVMLAGGVNRTDDLFIHVGFCALSAMSKSGRSRPFHRDADGLVPAEGAAMLALVRLEDAIARKHPILGVIRGVGLSNDGRGAGILAPSSEGQLRAMRRAYASAGLRPSDVSLVECHATGTPVGDATEVKSLARLFGDDGAREVPIGSLKSNLGHLITAAGAAGVMKVLGAIAAKTRPPTRAVEAKIDALAGTPLRLLEVAEPWTCEGPRRAAVSAFGFGGNDAHLVVEEHVPSRPLSVSVPDALARPPIAIVGLGAITAAGESAHALARTLIAGESRLRDHEGRRAGVVDAIEVDAVAMRFPPRDLAQALPQQLMILRAVHDAVADVPTLPRESTSVIVGMGCDPEIVRYGARWRAAEWGAALGQDDAWIAGARDAFTPALEAAGVVGTMPNIPANRVNASLDLGGPSFTVSAEELSGVVALELAARALRHGEIDAAIVGAVDVSASLVHAKAEAALFGGSSPGDAAIALVLKRHDDALRDGDTVLALIEARESTDDAEHEAGALSIRLGDGASSVTQRLGHPHAASGLLHVAVAALSLRHRALPASDAPGAPWLPTTTQRRARVDVASRFGGATSVSLVEDDAPGAPIATATPPRIHVFAGEDRAAVLAALEASREDGEGEARLAIVARDETELGARVERARARLRDPDASGAIAPGCYFHARPIGGEVAFVFTGAASAYRGMGRDLALAFPDAVDRLAGRFATMREAAGWIYERSSARAEPSPIEKLWGTSFLSQLHADLVQRVLGVRPNAAIGISSGETNALFALGAFRDLDAMAHDVDASGLYTTALGGSFGAVRAAWGEPASSDLRWENHRIVAPLAAVRAALEGESRVHVTIVNAEGDCVIGGEASACARVIDRVGRDRARSIGYDLACHAPEVEAWRAEWRALHRRAVAPVPGVRFYAHAFGTHYAIDSDSVADALTGQAVAPIDFPSLVEGAWRDGVRVFLEHGPQGGCSRWIEQTLARKPDARPHVAVSLDLAGESAIDRLVHAAAHLLAAGVPVDRRALESHLAAAHEGDARHRRPKPARSAPMRVAVHRPIPQLPALATTAQPTKDETMPVQSMLPAPWLPPVLDAAPRSAPHPEPHAPVHAAVHATVAHAPEGGELATVLAGVADVHARIADVHRGFLAQQAAVHQRFLDMRGAMPIVPMSAPVPVPVPASVFPPVPVPVPVLPTPAPAAHDDESDRARSRSRHGMDVDDGSRAPSRSRQGPDTPPLAPATLDTPRGPTFSRADLEVLASHEISRVFGPLFARQDDFRRQVRMPEPPLLLADRVLGIDAAPGELGRGTIWTETDVTWDAWYLHDGRMPAGVMIEAGQADLLLISWMGADFLNRGERVYRLLGCDLTYHFDDKRGLPRPGDTLRYDIHVDGHAQHGDVRLFFFHYDCRIDGQRALSVRHGQAGFFTDEELANSGGILWDATTGEHTAKPRLASPLVADVGARFSREQVRAFSEGRVVDCFGASHEGAAAHVRTPRIGRDRLNFLHEVTDCDPRGGAWKRGYLRAVTAVSPDDWFFAGHFKGDPCMPGTLMLEGCLEAMAFYLSALGFTLAKDGWRFEPVPEETYKLRCRGQVTPASRELVYEIFVDELLDDDGRPTLFADILCTVDGLKAFHCRRMGLRLVPDFPLSSRPELLAKPDAREAREIASIVEPDGVTKFRFDHASLLACAWGKPSDAFGQRFAIFDGTRRTPRLPGPPYHFMSRVARVDGELFVVKAGASIEVEYDVPPDAWYFDDTEGADGSRSMPFCVLLEAALQPCGWLASATGVTVGEPEDLVFRNLDGTATWHREVGPDAGTLKTRTKLRDLSRASGMIIVGFDVETSMIEDGLDVPVFSMKTVFGFFPKEALASQAGLPTTDDDRARLAEPCDERFELEARATPSAPRIGRGKLRILDRVTGLWRDGGKHGRGRIRAEMDVDPAAWFFQAHFFQDPVQPGSLGMEAMLQALQLFMIESGLCEGLATPRFEPMAIAHADAGADAVTWKYRGQVVATHDKVVVDADVVEIVRDARGVKLVADVSLWADGLRIYHAKKLAMRVTAGAHESLDPTLDPARDRWILDHRPTYTLPALPFTSLADRMATAAHAAHPSMRVVGLRDVAVQRWVVFPRRDDGTFAPLRFACDVGELCDGAVEVVLSRFRDAKNAALSRFEPVANGSVLLADTFPPAPARVADVPMHDAPDPYESSLFHGPAFRRVRRLRVGDRAASTILDASPGGVPLGTIAPLLLDAALHGVPHDRLETWAPSVGEGLVGYPSRIVGASFHAPTPTDGEVACEARFVRAIVEENRPPRVEIHLQLSHEGALFADVRLEEVLLPKGALGSASPAARRAFLLDGAFVPGLSLSRASEHDTRLAALEVAGSDWLPGTLACAYALDDRLDPTIAIAMKEHVARAARVHPSTVVIDERTARTPHLPLTRFSLDVAREGDDLVVRDREPPALDLAGVRAYWDARLGVAPWLLGDLYFGLLERFVRRVVVHDPSAMRGLEGRAAIFLGNHQVGIESLLFSIVASSMMRGSVSTLAKEEHRKTWIGELIELGVAHPGVEDPRSIVFFDRKDEASLLGIAKTLRDGLAERRSVMVHVEGTRALSARQRVAKMTSLWIDLAIESGAPIVPVRFSGGLPVEPLAARIEFPIGFGTQDIHLGRPIAPEALRAMTFAKRARSVLDAIDAPGRGFDLDTETPHAPDPAFEATIARDVREGRPAERAVLLRTLQAVASPSPQTSTVLAALSGASPTIADDARGRWLSRAIEWLAQRA